VEVSAPGDPLVWDWSEEGPAYGSDEVGDVFVVGSELSASPGWSAGDVRLLAAAPEEVSETCGPFDGAEGVCPADGLEGPETCIASEEPVEVSPPFNSATDVAEPSVGELDLSTGVDPVAGVWPKKPGSPTPPGWSGASSLSCGWVDRSSVFDWGVVVTPSAAGVGRRGGSELSRSPGRLEPDV